MMIDWKEFEQNMKNDIQEIFNRILESFDYKLNISARARAGAEISDVLEDAFVDYLTQHPHERVKEYESAPKDKTKNPFDIAWVYEYKDSKGATHSEKVWGDIKASKKTYKASNPDLGTPEKMIKFMLEGNFYLLYIFFEYEAHDNGLIFSKAAENNYVKCVFLKDIHNSVRINPKPQFQVNMKEKEQYRTRSEFIELFEQKYKESLDRIEQKAKEKRKALKPKFEQIKKLHD